jgi:uncharacterized protein (DUF169 family)
MDEARAVREPEVWRDCPGGRHMAVGTDWRGLGQELTGALHLATPPIGITFSAQRPQGVASFDAPMSEPAEDGRRGRVAAGCVFWARAADATFSTVAEDHGNCSVGRLTHGLATVADVAGNGDVAALVGSGWVTPEEVGQIPVITQRPGAITYGPLTETPANVDPDVVLLRVNGRQLMVLSDAIPGLRVEGKPQCHIVALAQEDKVAAASVGCALSRARTGMTPDEMTCAIPAGSFAQVVATVTATAATDAVVARYAAQDARRFS